MHPVTVVRLPRDGHAAELVWEPADDLAALERGLARAVADALAAGTTRLSARVDVHDALARRALHRTGFRLEGILRGTRPLPDGAFGDERLYARLAGDPVAGPLGFTSVMNTVTPRKRLIAHALVTDAAGRVLLCETSFKDDFELPGGIVEPGESPLSGCRREMDEEMGTAPEVVRLLVVDWLHPHLGWEDAVEMVFGTAPLTDAEAASLQPDGHEILALHWLEPDEAALRVAPYAAGRLRAALAAAVSGTTVYLEDGRPTG